MNSLSRTKERNIALKQTIASVCQKPLAYEKRVADCLTFSKPRYAKPVSAVGHSDLTRMSPIPEGTDEHTLSMLGQNQNRGIQATEPNVHSGSLAVADRPYEPFPAQIAGLMSPGARLSTVKSQQPRLVNFVPNIRPGRQAEYFDLPTGQDVGAFMYVDGNKARAPPSPAIVDEEFRQNFGPYAHLF